VVVINEFADLALGHSQFESLLAGVSAQSGQVGIHCILSTSRPSAEYITPEFKKLISGRIALTTASPAESVTILGVQGCEHLLGRGDMLYLDQYTTFPVRVHCTSIAEHEITGVIEYAKRYGQPEYRDDQIFAK
jgi:S-DNA-T family DNA segregation ATPase FtsK/SpoIIIE